MRTQILQASLSHMQAIGLGLNTRDRKLQLLNIHIFIEYVIKNSHTPMF